MKKWKVIISVIFAFLLTLGVCFGVGKQIVSVNPVVAVATANEIKQVQQRLKEFGYYYGPVDGVYSEATKQAVIKFQKEYGLNAEGYIGPLTLGLLGISSGGAGSVSQQNNDLYLLAKCVHAEARGESYVGKVAVAAVILNRVKHPSFPNTIAGVIYQPWAFTAVFDGQINLEPDQSAYSAAQDALNGWDPTYGCIYYYNPVTATNKWILSREIVIQIGKHVFAR